MGTLCLNVKCFQLGVERVEGYCSYFCQEEHLAKKALLALPAIASNFILSDPNRFGEAFRRAIFVKFNDDDILGHNSFNVNSEFYLVDRNHTDGQELLKTFTFKDDVNDFLSNSDISIFSDRQILVAWYSDSDSALLIISKEAGKGVINDDAKKDYGWKWIDV